jgi:hypothetical protein
MELDILEKQGPEQKKVQGYFIEPTVKFCLTEFSYDHAELKTAVDRYYKGSKRKIRAK